MFDLDHTRLIHALSYLVMAMFLSAAFVSSRYRLRVRWATIVLYLASLALALVWVGLWLAG